MKKILTTMLILLLICTNSFYVFANESPLGVSPLALIGDSATISRGDKSSQESSSVTLTDGNPAITQEDYDSQFCDYADELSTLQFPQTQRGHNNLSPVVGMVLDNKTKSPIPNATISVNNQLTFTTDSNGRFQINSMPSGIYSWYVSAEHYKNGTFLNYDVDSMNGATIFSFYIDTEREIVRNEFDTHQEGQAVPPALEENNPSASRTMVPQQPIM